MTNAVDSTGTVFGIGARDWTVDGQTLTVSLNENHQWQDGKSVTADDWIFQYELEQFVAEGGRNVAAKYEWTENIEATGEHELTFELNAPLAPEFAADEILYEFLWAHPPTFQEYHDQFTSASGDSEIQEARNALNDFRWEDPIYPGALQYVSSNPQRMVLEVHQNYPFEEVQQQYSDATDDDITDWGTPNLDQVNFKFAPDSNKVLQESKAGNVDGGYGIGPFSRENPPISDDYRVVAYSTGFGQGLWFNFWSEEVAGDNAGLEWFKIPEVRQALAHVIDRKAVGRQLMPSPDSVKDDVMTGMNASQEEQYVSQEVMDQLNPYEQSTEKATQLLESAGFSKEGGNWITPDGDQFSIRFRTASSVNTYVKATDVATSNLNQFGIATQTATASGSEFFSADPAERGYQMTPGWSFGGAGPGPANTETFMYQRPRSAVGGGDGLNDYLPGMSHEEEVLEVPPIGQPDSDERIEVNPHETIRALALNSTSDEEKQELLDEIAWATNWWVPKISCAENVYTALINPSKFKYPPEGAQSLTARPTHPMIFQLGIVDGK
nr:ABC transporter substrate-binding protein [Halomarina oriensis]